MVLLHFMRWVKSQGLADIRLILIRGGDMIGDFQNVCETWVWMKPAKAVGLKQQLIRRVTGSTPVNPQDEIRNAVKEFAPEVIYGNTVAAQPLGAELKLLTGAKLISHVHELEFSLNAYFAAEMHESIVKRIDHFVTVSDANCKVLTQRFEIPADKVSLIYEFIDVKAFSQPSVPVHETRRKMNLSDHFIIGGSGVPSWRKGFDLFIQTAAEVSKLSLTKPVAFVWVGNASSYDRSMLAYQIERLNIKVPVILTGQTESPSDYFQDFDIFYLPSREDPFPLVCLEAASLNKPVMCFSDSGGMPEFVSKGGGWTMPYENCTAVAEKIAELIQSADEIRHKGKVAASMVADYDVTLAAPRIWKLI